MNSMLRQDSVKSNSECPSLAPVDNQSSAIETEDETFQSKLKIAAWNQFLEAICQNQINFKFKTKQEEN